MAESNTIYEVIAAYDKAIEQIVNTRNAMAYEWNHRTDTTPEERNKTTIPYKWATYKP